MSHLLAGLRGCIELGETTLPCFPPPCPLAAGLGDKWCWPSGGFPSEAEAPPQLWVRDGQLPVCGAWWAPQWGLLGLMTASYWAGEGGLTPPCCEPGTTVSVLKVEAPRLSTQSPPLVDVPRCRMFHGPSPTLSVALSSEQGGWGRRGTEGRGPPGQRQQASGIYGWVLQGFGKLSGVPGESSASGRQRASWAGRAESASPHSPGGRAKGGGRRKPYPPAASAASQG